MPNWRKVDSNNPPMSSFCKYAYDILDRIASEQEDFDGKTVHAEYNQFLKEGEDYVQKMKSRFQSTSTMQPSYREDNSLTFYNSKVQSHFKNPVYNRRSLHPHPNGYQKPRNSKWNDTRSQGRSQIQKSFSHQQQWNTKYLPKPTPLPPSKTAADFQEILSTFT